jgi:hypothetical protein
VYVRLTFNLDVYGVLCYPLYTTSFLGRPDKAGGGGEEGGA